MPSHRRSANERETVGEYIAQKAKTRHDRAECRGLRQDIGKLDFQQVARGRTLYKHRTGQRMHDPWLDRGKIGSLHARFDLAVECVARFQRDLFTFANLCDR